MGKIIMVASGKGGVGKTTVTANISIALSSLGKSVIAVDADLGLRNLDLALGFENSVVYDIVDAVLENCRVREAVIKDEKYGKLSFLPASQFKDDIVVEFSKYSKLFEELKDKYDYVVIDCPAGIGDFVKNIIKISNLAIIVANPDPYSLRDADKLAYIMENEGLEDIRLVINRLRKKLISKGIMPDINGIIEALAVKLLGVINEDEKFIECSITGVPLVMSKKNKQQKAFLDIANRIEGKNIPITEIKRSRLFR